MNETPDNKAKTHTEEPYFLIVSEHTTVALAVEKVLNLLTSGIEGRAVRPCQPAPVGDGICEGMIVDLDAFNAKSFLQLLSGFEQLPETVFMSLREGRSYLGDQANGDPLAWYFVRKYQMLWGKRHHGSVAGFLEERFVSSMELTSLQTDVFTAAYEPIPNVFRNMWQILADFGLENDTEVIRRLPDLDSDFTPDERHRDLARLRDFHRRGESVKKRMIAELLMDNMRYLEESCPTRKVLWIEDNPDVAVEDELGRAGVQTLRQAVVHTFDYYPNMSLFLLQTGFEKLFGRLDSACGKDTRILDELVVEQVVGPSCDGAPVSLKDFQAVVLDLNFEEEERICGKDLVPPLTKVHPSLPIVVCSRSADPGVTEAVLRLGADFYLSKAQAYSVPIYVNRCYALMPDGRPLFVQKSRLRQVLLQSRHQIRIPLDQPDSESQYDEGDLSGYLQLHGATGVAAGVEFKEEHSAKEASSAATVFIYKTRDIFRWRDVFICLDEVEGLGRYLEAEGSSKAEVCQAMDHFGFSHERAISDSYQTLYEKSQTSRFITALSRFHEQFGEFIFGATSGILTTSGTLVGVYAATERLSAVMAGVVAVGVSDSWSDAFSMYSEDLSDRGTSSRDAFRHAAKTFVGKLVFPVVFILPLLATEHFLGDFRVGMFIDLALGAVILAIVSAERALVQREGASGVAREIARNLGLALLILVCSVLAGLGVHRLFGS